MSQEARFALTTKLAVTATSFVLMATISEQFTALAAKLKAEHGIECEVEHNIMTPRSSAEVEAEQAKPRGERKKRGPKAAVLASATPADPNSRSVEPVAIEPAILVEPVKPMSFAPMPAAS